RLDDKRGFHKRELRAVRLIERREPFAYYFQDARMQDLVQLRAPLRIAEDDRAELATVHFAAGSENIVAEFADDLVVRRLPRLEQFVAERIGFQHHAIAFAQHVSHSRLARCNSAGKAHSKHARLASISHARGGWHARS